MDDLPQTPPASEPPPASRPLTYEEAPVINPEGTEEVLLTQEEQPVLPPEPPPPAVPPPVRRRPSFFGFIGNIFLFAVLFGVGIWLSTVIRPYLPGASSVPGPATTTPAVTQGPPAPTAPPDPYAGWQTYQVISGPTRQPVAGISFKLPPDVLSPICDGTNCASQGTYLPGGTRFTVAARGAGQALRDYRGAIVTDVLGQPFITKEALISGKSGVSFTGTFTGTTIGGYAFSRMAGAMIPVTDTVSVEINHFTPSGVTADFETDASLFEKILASVVVTGASGGEKGAVMPVEPLR
ncbi:MAG: hypothetical protein AAB803_03200 [Patescibacteria group bacterium]